MNSTQSSSGDLLTELNILKQENEQYCKKLKENSELLNIYKEEAEKYKSIFSGSLDVIMITDGKNGKIIDISDAARTVLGYIPSDLIGCHYSTILPHFNDNENPKLLEEIDMFGPVLSSRLVKMSDGSLSPMDLTINVINLNGIKAVQTSFRDAAERNKAEEGIKTYLSQLHDLNKSKDKFFSVLAHDLRSPFTGLLGLSQMLVEDIDEMPKDEMVHYISEINITIKSVYQLLNNLLEWSWVNSGDMQFNPEVIDPDEKIQDVIQLLSMNASYKKIEISFCSDGIKSVAVDVNMFKSIIQNLISNSIKFTKESGRILVETSKSNDNVIIKISDTGIGISEENIKKIFSPDETFSTRGTQDERGSGLGIALCRELVKKNNGAISLESQLNIGTTFTLKFPVKK